MNVNEYLDQLPPRRDSKLVPQGGTPHPLSRQSLGRRDPDIPLRQPRSYCFETGNLGILHATLFEGYRRSHQWRPTVFGAAAESTRCGHVVAKSKRTALF